MFVANLPELIDKETIYDSTGHVDTEFMTAILEFMSRMAQVTNDVNKSLARLLGIEETEGKKNTKEDNGSRWSVEEILKHCTLEDNVLKLPQVQFNKKSYAEAKKWIEEAGGIWQGGKVQGFIFPFYPERVLSILNEGIRCNLAHDFQFFETPYDVSILNEGKRCNLAQDFQFFETPSDVADWLVMLAGGIHEHDKVLEPSAGRGALVRAIHRSSPDVVVDCYEMMPENKELLSGLGGIGLAKGQCRPSRRR